jgi:hypothetical protein
MIDGTNVDIVEHFVKENNVLLLFVIISVIIMKCKSDYIGETHSQKG